jgi:hypothetical protein
VAGFGEPDVEVVVVFGFLGEGEGVIFEGVGEGDDLMFVLLVDVNGFGELFFLCFVHDELDPVFGLRGKLNVVLDCFLDEDENLQGGFDIFSEVCFLEIFDFLGESFEFGFGTDFQGSSHDFAVVF